MPLDLDRLQQRIVGVLVEKEHTVPDAYPLTLNALVAGCNQKSNRDPQMSVEPYEVEGALRALMDEGWVRERDVAGGRALRYEHHMGEQLGVEAPDLAILAELLLRGPQSPGELKTRASRMKPFESPGAVEARLEALADRPVPYVEVLPRRPREHAPRWRHRLGTTTTDEEAHEAPAAVPAPSPPSAPTAPPPVDDDRLEQLETRIADLEARLDRLEGR